ncbi:MAG: hypothetical protein HY654_06970 [Acidobacteria bacterium]|nr:hypothetical protein [Acidobacteriota bacterium]
MPYDDPEINDPHELVGIELPGDPSVTREMAAAFADEFAQLGLTRAQILALYRRAEYAGAHRAWRLLGEREIARLVDESLAVWGSVRRVVVDATDTGSGLEKSDSSRSGPDFSRPDPTEIPLRLFKRS